MTSRIETDRLDRFRGAIRRIYGLDLDDSKSVWLESLLDRHDNADRWLDLFESSTEEQRRLATELTVGETYFFRHLAQFRAFADVALTDRLKARASTRELRILSAGSSSGEEAYTLAMLIKERALDPSWQVTIRGADINPVVLEKAVRGKYTQWSLRETPPASRSRWFRTDGRDFMLDPEILRAVQFEEHNLVGPSLELWAAESWDIVFCRNVMMYFSPAHMAELVARFTRSLVKGGWLFLGHAETLRGLSHDFHLRHTHETFYYQLKARHGEYEAPIEHGLVPAPEPPVPIEEGLSSSWIDSIKRASERIERLHAPAPIPSRAVDHQRRIDLSPALALFAAESYGPALDRLETISPATAKDPDAMLLAAVLNTHRGDLPTATALANELLAIDELHAGAHYVLALCAEASGDLPSAADHDQIAAYLEPSFAMPHLHLGLMARKASTFDVARVELEKAMALLQSEEASRIVLFAGGFSRDALIALCRAELGRIGARG